MLAIYRMELPPISPNGRRRIGMLIPHRSQLEVTFRNFKRWLNQLQSAVAFFSFHGIIRTLKQKADNIRTSIGMLFTFPDVGNPGMM